MEIDPHQLQEEAYRYEVFTALVRDYQELVFRYCVARVGADQAEEIAQDVFLTAWEALAKFRQASAVSTWLVGIAKYKCIQAFRNRTRRTAIAHTFVGDIRQSTHVNTPESPEALLVSATRFTDLVNGLAQLRDDERLLLTLRYYRNLSVAEVAELLGKSEAAVRKRLLRALQRLRTTLDEG